MNEEVSFGDDFSGGLVERPSFEDIPARESEEKEPHEEQGKNIEFEDIFKEEVSTRDLMKEEKEDQEMFLNKVLQTQKKDGAYNNMVEEIIGTDRHRDESPAPAVTRALPNLKKEKVSETSGGPRVEDDDFLNNLDKKDIKETTPSERKGVLAPKPAANVPKPQPKPTPTVTQANPKKEEEEDIIKDVVHTPLMSISEKLKLKKANILTINKGGGQGSIKSRTFSLVPCGVFAKSEERDEFIESDRKEHEKFLWSDSADIAQLKSAFEQIRDLQNAYLVKMLEIGDSIKDLNYFKSTSVESVGRIYGDFDLRALNTELSERIGRYCLQNPFHAVRNYLIRNHDLHDIAERLVSYLTQNRDLKALFSFLYEKSPNSFENSVFSSLEQDVFGEKRKLSIYLLHNMLGQIRNILFSQLDPSLLQSLPAIYNSLISMDLLEKVLSSFSRRMSLYFSWIIRYKHIDDPDFKKTTDALRRQLKASMLSFTVPGVTEEFFRDLKEKAFENELEFLRKFSIAGFFSEFTPRARFRFHEYYDAFTTDNREQFESFFIKTFVHDFKQFALSFYHSVLKEALVEVFIDKYYGRILATLDFIRQSDIKSFVNKPQMRKLSLPINSSENFSYVNRENFGTQADDYIQLSFYPNRLSLFRIHDRNGILGKMLRRHDDIDNMGFPTISFREYILHDRHKSQQIRKFAKILLSVPFEFEKGNKKENPRDVVVDLNIRDFAVISVIEKTSHRTVAVFFVGQRALFDMKFDATKKRFVLRKRFSENKNPRLKARRKSNIFRKLYILRKRANKWQSLSRSATGKAEKELYSSLFSQTWEHIRNINREIVRLLGSVINKIAVAFRGDIKMEYLKWHVTKSKRVSGKFLAFWNIHFMFSQIEECTENIAKSLGIPFYRVDPRGTSTRCSNCGLEGTLYGRTFYCEHCGLMLNRDINADRNIHTAPIIPQLSI